MHILNVERDLEDMLEPNTLSRANCSVFIARRYRNVCNEIAASDQDLGAICSVHRS
jgi:hypothetical protein